MTTDHSQESLYAVALTLVHGLGAAGAARLLEACGSASAVFCTPEAELVRLGVRASAASQIALRKTLADAERELRRAGNAGVQAIHCGSPLYPPLLRECADYPAVLYVQGNVQALGARSLAMVGTRRMTQYGLRVCQELVASLAERVPGLCIVSGLAFGVDAACHRAALRGGAGTVAVIPAPLPEIVPSQNTGLARAIVEAGGAVVSELSSLSGRGAGMYIPRNRLIAGLSHGCVVVESSFNGGAMHTAGFADGYDRTLMAVPGRVTDELSAGPNMLIRSQKAQMVCSAEDVIRAMSWDLQPDTKPAAKRPAVEMQDSWRAILKCFRDQSHLSGDELCQMCAVSPAELSPLLLEMEFAGLLSALPGNIYEKRC